MSPFNAAECSGCMRMKVMHCLSPDWSGRVCGTAADDRCARVAEGQVEGAFSFASFCGCALRTSLWASKENEERRRHDSAMLACWTTGDAMWDSFARDTETTGSGIWVM